GGGALLRRVPRSVRRASRESCRGLGFDGMCGAFGEALELVVRGEGFGEAMGCAAEKTSAGAHLQRGVGDAGGPGGADAPPEIVIFRGTQVRPAPGKTVGVGADAE